MKNVDSQIEDGFVEIEKMDRDAFLSCMETLTRLGLPSKPTKAPSKPTLTQLCHILHRRGKYFIVHYKQALMLEGRAGRNDFTEEDRIVTNTVADLLKKWNLVSIKRNPYENKDKMRDKGKFLAICHKDKANWILVSNFSIVKRVKEESESAKVANDSTGNTTHQPQKEVKWNYYKKPHDSKATGARR